MRHILLFAFLIGSLTSVAQSNSQLSGGRYQIATVATSPYIAVMIDTQTGRIWRNWCPLGDGDCNSYWAEEWVQNNPASKAAFPMHKPSEPQEKLK